MISRTMKMTAVAGAALLSMGIAGPAMATGGAAGTGTSSKAAGHVQPTLAELQAWISKTIDARLAWIVKIQARVDASTVLTTQQTTDLTARLAAKTAALAALKAAVAAATTTDGIEAAIKASGVRDELFFGHELGRGHHQARPAGAWRCGDPAQRPDATKGRSAATKSTAGSARSLGTRAGTSSHGFRAVTLQHRDVTQRGDRGGWNGGGFGGGFGGGHGGHGGGR